MTNKGYTNYASEPLELSFPCDTLPEDRCVMIFTAYFDESGKWTDPKVQDMVLAGYIATNNQWAQFEHEWKQAISEFGLPYFHMSEYAAKRPPYDTWTNQQREIRFARLVEIINANTTCSIGVTLPRLEYAVAMGEISKVVPAKEYGFSFNFIILMARFALAMKGHIKPQIAYVLDRGMQHSGEIISIMDKLGYVMDRVSPNHENVLGYLSARTENKERFVPLQAADILAYQLYRFGANYHRNVNYVRYPKHLKMLETKDAHWIHLDESEIRYANHTARPIQMDLLKRMMLR